MTYIRPGLDGGRVARKVAALLLDQGFYVDFFSCAGNRGREDVYSWEAFGWWEAFPDVRRGIGCFDTMTTCAKHGLSRIDRQAREVSAIEQFSASN